MLFVLSLLSYWKYGKSRQLCISLLFLLFVVQGILLSLSLFIDVVASVTSSVYIWVLTLLILVLLYIVILKK